MEENGVTLTREQMQTVERLAEEGKTPLLFARKESMEQEKSTARGKAGNGNMSGGTCRFIAIIAVADTVKESSMEAIRQLEQMHIRTIMLTGDNKKTAEAVRKKLGMEEVIAEVLPGEKRKKSGL